jgi:sulfofructose kinase
VKRQRIIGLGLCVIDHVYRVEHLDLAESRLRFVDRLEAAGGMTATALRQASSLGCRTELLSLLGDDADGRRVRRALRADGVGTRRLVLSPDSETTVAVCLVEKGSGERRFLVADRRRLERGAPDFDLSAIRPGTLLLIDGHFAAQALRAVRRAREVGARVIADFSRPTPAAKRLLPFVDHPIVPEEFARHLFDGDAPRTLAWLAERSRGAPIITQGALGGVYLDGQRVRRYRARRARVVDTTGAGDVFHGAFAAALAHGLDLESGIDLGARAAAVCCTALGGGGRLLERDEVPYFT